MPTDLHCHLLPGLDDGPASEAAALELAAMVAASGVDRVAVTPHVNERYRTTPEAMMDAVGRLRAGVAEQGVELDVVAGAEVAASRLVDLEADALRSLTLGGGSWLLLEPPLTGAFPFERAVEHVAQAGLEVLIAHPERCELFQREPERLTRLVEGGARLSITAASLVGAFGRIPANLARHLVDDGLVANVATDAHGPDRRAPRLLDQLEEAGLVHLAGAWCDEFPASVLGTGRADADTGGTMAPSQLEPPDAAVETDPLADASRMLDEGATDKVVLEHLLDHFPRPTAERRLRRLVRERRPA